MKMTAIKLEVLSMVLYAGVQVKMTVIDLILYNLSFMSKILSLLCEQHMTMSLLG